MPPKTKSSKTENATMSSNKDMSTIFNTNLQTKDNYGVYILNTRTDGAQSILREFIARAKERKRNVVAPIVLDEIEKNISLEKAVASTIAIDAREAGGSNAFSYHATPDEVFQVIKIRIAEYIEKHDSFLAQSNTIKKLDLLQHWEELAATATRTTSDKKVAKDASNKKGSTASNEAKAKGKQTNAGKGGNGSEYDDENCNLAAIPDIELISKTFSQFSHGSGRALQKYITDNPEDGPFLYIIIIGSVSPEFCLHLLREKYPLRAIFSVCSTDEDWEIDLHPTLCDDLSNHADTKPVKLQNIIFPNINKCDAFKNSQKIYNELCWLMYDVTTSKRQHANFLANLTEVNVDLRDASCDTDIGWMVPDKQTELDIVPLYLEGLLSQVVASESDDSAKFSKESFTEYDIWDPFIELYGKQIVEYRNEIMRNSLANKSYDIAVYPKHMEILSKYGIPNFLWWKIDGGVQTQRLSWESSGTTSKFDSKLSYLYGSDISFIEAFTKNTMTQRLNYLNDTYDFNYIEHCQDKGELDICFYNCPDQYFETKSTVYIPTKICFRDYCKYVAAEIHDWVQAQEKCYNKGLAEDSVTQCQSKVYSFDDITDADFVMMGSMKTMSDLERQESPSMNPEIPEQLSQFIANDALSDTTLERKNYLKYAFTAYNIGDTRFQITSTKANFKTVGGFVHLLEDKFPSGELLLHIDMDYFGDRILFHHVYPRLDGQLPMKIICGNSAIINFRMHCIEQNGKLNSEETLQPSKSHYFEVHCAWPTGLQTRTYCDEATGNVLWVEQTVVSNENAEVKRLYYPDGKVVIYYQTDFVDILTPSGLNYVGTKFESMETDVASSFLEEDENCDASKLRQEKYLHEITAFDGLKCEVFKDKFRMNSPDGCSFDIFDGSVVREHRKQHLTEWYDFALGEQYAMLEGGTKTRLVANKFEVLYKNGTFITTVTEEEAILENFEPEEATPLGSTQSLENSSNGGSAVAIAGNLVDKMLDKASEGYYASCSRTFLIQHKDYATVHFGEDQVKISCPDETHIILKSNELRIDIKSQLRVNCNPKKCIVRGCKYPDQNNFVEAEFNFNPQIEPLLNILSGIDSELEVGQNGTRRYKSKAEKCRPKFINPTERRIVVNRRLEGYEVHTRFQANAIKERAEQLKYIVMSDCEGMTILQPVTPFSNHYRTPVVGIEDFMEKFNQKDQPCTAFLLPSAIALNQIPDLMTVRVLILASKYFRRMHPSTAEILSISPPSLEEPCYLGESGQNILRFIKQEAKRALDSYLVKITPKSIPDVEVRIAPSDHFLKFKQRLEEQQQRKNRKLIYEQIIRHKFCPKYADFKEADWRVAKMDVLPYHLILNKLERKSPRTLK